MKHVMHTVSLAGGPAFLDRGSEATAPNITVLTAPTLAAEGSVTALTYPENSR